MAGNHQRQAKVVSQIALPGCRSTGFQTHLERRFTPGRLEGIGYTAGLEIWAAKTTSIVYRNTVISRRCKKCIQACCVPQVKRVSLTVPGEALSRRAPGRCGLFLFLLGLV